jgi:integrase
MGSIYVRGNRIWFRTKNRAGKWTSLPSAFDVGDEAAALKELQRLEDHVGAQAAIDPGGTGPLTLRKYADKWLEGRKEEIASWENDESRLRLYVYPELGDALMRDIRPRHIRDLFKKLRQRLTERKRTKLAPRTIYNTYSLVSALFRDAAVDGIVDTTPCILRAEAHLGAKVDADPRWRQTARYTRDELRSLVSDPRIPLDRRALWGLLGIGGLRPTEGFRLRFKDLDWESEPLPMLFLPETKTDVPRPVPVHPALEVLLRDWIDNGWELMMGRKPTGEDLVVPMPETSRGPAGRERENSRNLKLLHHDLDLLGFRHRRAHDLRHTMISLCRSDGAVKDILKRATHQPPKEVIDGYTHFEWDVVCAEVLKLKLDVHTSPPPSSPPSERGSVVSGSYVEGTGGFATAIATVAAQTQRSPGNLSASGASFLRGVGDLNP